MAAVRAESHPVEAGGKGGWLPRPQPEPGIGWKVHRSGGEGGPRPGTDGQRWTPLHHAAAAGHCAVARLLLLTGASLAARAEGQWSPGVLPLHVAAEAGQEDCVRCLLQVWRGPGRLCSCVEAQTNPGLSGLKRPPGREEGSAKMHQRISANRTRYAAVALALAGGAF